MIGQKIGNYSLVRLLGKGGMGQVYEGVHEQLRRRAAIKILLPEFSTNQEFSARFFNEALAVNVVQHPSIVNVYESGRLPDGAAYIVMEFLDGVTLQNRIQKQGAFSEPEALSIARQIASALAAAHSKDIIHRDLKAENVMLVQDPEVPGGKRVKILDFGLAKVTSKHQGAQAVATKDGVVMGTPAYMPPEQWMSASTADAKTDVYALGVMLYLMLTEKFPFAGVTIENLMVQHMYEPHIPLRQNALQVSLQTVELVDAMLSKTQKSRPTMAEVSARLEKILATLPSPVSSGSVQPPAAWDAQSAPTRISESSEIPIAQTQLADSPNSIQAYTRLAQPLPLELMGTQMKAGPSGSENMSSAAQKEALVPTPDSAEHQFRGKLATPAPRSQLIKPILICLSIVLAAALAVLLLR